MNSHPLVLWIRRGFQLVFNIFALSVLFLVSIWVGVFWHWHGAIDLARFEEMRIFIWRNQGEDLRSWFFVYGSASLSLVSSLLVASYLDAKFKKRHDLFSRGASIEDCRGGTK